ncbi:MAG: N-6 DNA methylase [Proteobacteria bacterium]|nr:N-6 DNA methylase [Pseudomonadota bacterium]
MSVALDLDGVAVSGPAVTPTFLHYGLVPTLTRFGLLPPAADALPAALAANRPRGIAAALGFSALRRQDPVTTREGQEDGGWLAQSGDAIRLRMWIVPRATDLDAGVRDSPMRVAQRVLLAKGEAAGLIANGQTLRLLWCDAHRTDSFMSFPVAAWGDEVAPPDAARVLAALAGARGLPRLTEVLQAASAHQARVTTDLRRQAKLAILGFINALPDIGACDAAALWRDSLLLVYRLLFILKLESAGDGFSFASTTLWRTALSPNQALGPLVRRCLDQGADTGRMLQDGLRTLFALCRAGLCCDALHIAPLGGGLFGAGTMTLLEHMDWGDRAVAVLLDRLIWISGSSGERARVHYGSLDVEDLGSIYESLLEQEPGIATEPLLRQRAGRFEAVLPAGGAPPDILPGSFFLRAGPGRKASGAYYTPQDLVQFLVREALAPKLAALSPPDDPRPADLLRLRIVDPAMGSGHFLVEACRQLAEALLADCITCDRLGLHDRIAALPDVDNSLAPYLPSHGFAEARARAICRRLVAVHCLYGCDRNDLAVELAKLSLWLESYAEGLPLTFLDHRLIAGNALTGPFSKDLTSLPVTGGPLDPLLARGVAERLGASVDEARELVRALDASIGRSIDDLTSKQALKQHLDDILTPLRCLARAWAGAAMLRDRDADDIFLSLAGHVADTGSWPARQTPRQLRLLEAGRDAVPWDLAFPEIFPGGFSIVLGNPPWDVVLPNRKDFLATYDPSVLAASTRTSRDRIERRLLCRPDIASAFETYKSGIDHTRHIIRRLYRRQRVEASAGSLDLYRLFAERGLHLAADHATIAWVLPSSFHAAEGSTGIRKAYLSEASLDWLLSFENRRRIFDIDSRYKFDLVVARRPGPTRSIRCGFYLEDLRDTEIPGRIMRYDTGFLAKAGGARLTPLELRGEADLRLAEQMFMTPHRFGAWCASQRIRFGCDLHMTQDARLFRPVNKADLTLHEGKTFHQYTDRWDTAPRHSVVSADLPPTVAEAAMHHRLAFRDIARSNDERTMIAFLAPPGVVFGHTATVEKTPWARPAEHALLLCALLNSFCFDWLVRQKAATHLSLYILDALPVPDLNGAQRRFLANAAHRLSVAKVRDDPLRANVDAVIAQAYGLNRAAFAHLLSGFSHRSRPDAPAQCLAAFDALSATPIRSVA